MNKLPKTRQELVDAYIKSLEEGDLIWEQMWQTFQPENGASGKKYRGVNNLYLSYISLKRGYKDNRWVTYNQMSKKNWSFIKEAKGQGITVEYWGMKNKVDNKIYSFPDYNKIVEENPDKAKEFRASKMSYVVFNGDLVDGLVNNPNHPQNEIISNEYIENIINNLGVQYQEGGNDAYYNPISDKVVIPPSSSFKTTYSYYATQLHELSHSTGHESRLNRNIKNRFGSEEYAKEELRAEISSSFLMQKFHLEVDNRHLENHKSYVKSWLELLKNEPQELFDAITEANQIVDYLEENSIQKSKESIKIIEEDLEVEK